MTTDRDSYTPGKMLKALLRQGALPPGGDLNARRGEYCWPSGDFVYRFLVYRNGPLDEPSGLARQLDVLPSEQYQKLTHELFLILYPLEAASGVDHVGEAAEFIRKATTVVKDIEDYCRLSCFGGNPAGIGLRGGGPGYAVRALPLVRVLGFEDIEAQVARMIYLSEELESDVDPLSWAKTQIDFLRTKGINVELPAKPEE